MRYLTEKERGNYKTIYQTRLYTLISVLNECLIIDKEFRVLELSDLEVMI